MTVNASVKADLEPSSGEQALRSLPGAALAGELLIQNIQCLLDTLAIDQTGVPVSVWIQNRSEVDIEIRNVSLVFTYTTLGDRNSDYEVSALAGSDPMLSPNESEGFDFEVDLLSGALTGELISVQAFVVGISQDDLREVSVSSGEEHTVLDQFESVSFGNNDGSASWADDWVELGESDGPGEGAVSIGLDPVFGINCLRVGSDIPVSDVGIMREAALEDASSAVLTFTYACDPVDGFLGRLTVQVSEDGAGDWIDLELIGDGSDLVLKKMLFDISDYVSPTTTIRFQGIGACSGYVYIDDIRISYIRESEAHSWIVLENGLTADVALFDTKGTPDRSDDSLMYQYSGEVFTLNSVHYFNDGEVLTDIPVAGSGIYRLVYRYKSTSDWEWEPKDGFDKGYLALSDSMHGFGRISLPQPGLKEFLLTETMVPDEEDDPADFVVGVTNNHDPPHEWDMLTDPWIDPLVDNGKTGEWASIVEELSPPRWIIGCDDGGKDWEVTGKLEDGRSYFHEMWFQPDLDWNHGDTADVYLHITGHDGVDNLEALHSLFKVVDDDTVGPVFSAFSPEIVPEGEEIYIECQIEDPSGVYDDNSGSDGQGVYVKYDTDGSLENGFFEIQMSSAGGDDFILDSPIPAQVNGVEIIYAVHACDYDTDTGIFDRACSVSGEQTIQVIGAIAVYDDPASLVPSSVYPGQEEVIFHIDLSNLNTGTIYLDPGVSFMMIDDGTYSIVANLLNETYLAPGSGGFPIAFDAVDIPAEFSSPDTISLTVHLEGIYNETIPWDQTWVLSVSNRLVINEPRLYVEAHPLPSPEVNPGERMVELMRMEMTNEGLGEVSLDSIVLNNITVGNVAVPGNDINIERLFLYRGGDDGAVQEIIPMAEDERGLLRSRPFSEGDTLAASAVFEGGQAVFNLTKGRSIPVFDPVYFYVMADIDSFMASDGDRIDVEISSCDSIFTSGPVSIDMEAVPLRSEGANRIDGFMSFQARIVDGVPDTVYSGTDCQHVLIVDLPANGYAPDIISGLSVVNYGDAEVTDVIELLGLWVDGGDGVFSSDLDTYLGPLQYTGEQFQITGLSRHVIGSQRFFLAARFGQEFSEGLSVKFGIPVDGVRYVSGNDGPIDVEMIADSAQVLIRREYISIEALQAGGGTPSVHPSEKGIELLALGIVNNTLSSITPDSLILRGAPGLFECESGKKLDLFLDDGDGLFDPLLDTPVSSGQWSGDSCGVGISGVEISTDSEAVLFVSTDLDSFASVDGDTLSIRIESADDLTISAVTVNPYEIDGDFPLTDDTPPVVDGMMSFQIPVFPVADSIVTGILENILVMDFELPGNGCMHDTLTGISVVNMGSATRDHIERILIWEDDGDGRFDPAVDDSAAVLEENGINRYQASGLSIHLDGTTNCRFFITVDLRSSFSTGATILAGIPGMGIEVSSGNDGPIDGLLYAANGVVIPVPDRVTFIASSLDNKKVHPGEKNILNIVLGAYNSYSDAKVIQSIVLLKSGPSKPGEIVSVSAYADNNDGLFDPDLDELLETVESTGALFSFESLDMALAPFKSSLIFFAYDLPAEGVRDSISIDFSISDQSFIRFDDVLTIIEGEFPLESAGMDVTDGMIARQIDVHHVPSVRVSPEDTDVPCFSLTLPCNGTEADSLESFSIENSGTCLPGIDLVYLKLWKDSGGDAKGFDPGMEEFVDFLVWNGESWSNVSGLSEQIDCGGLTLHITVDIAATANDDRTVLLTLPVDGVQVASGNDGPVDTEIVSPAKVIITTDPLIVSFDDLQTVTLGQQFDVDLHVSNVSDTILTQVHPDSFLWTGGGGLTLLTGPVPSAIDLGGQTDSTFSWTFQAAGEGSIVFQAKTVEQGGDAESRLELSDTLVIEGVPDNVNITFDDLSPVNLNRGHSDASIIEMTISYGTLCNGCAAIGLSSLDLRFTDGSGSSIEVNDVASRIVLEDESMMLFTESTSGIEDSVITLLPIEHEDLKPGDIRTYRISLDIAETAAAGNFRIFIDSSDYLIVSDQNSGDPVTVSGVDYPWSTNTVTLKDPAVELMAGMEKGMPGRVNRGQNDIGAFRIILTNSSGMSGADISVSRIEFEVMEHVAGDLEPGDILSKFRLCDAYEYDHYVTETFSGTGIECVFEPEMIVSPSMPLELNAFIDLLTNPGPDSFTVVLLDSLAVTARDVNSGETVEVLAGEEGDYTFPMNSGHGVLVDPLSGFSVTAQGVLPGRVTAGTDGTEALRLTMHHTGSPGESGASISGITLRILNQKGEGIAQNSVIDAIRVLYGDSLLSAVYTTAVDTSSYIHLTIEDEIVIEAGSSTDLDIHVDIGESAVPGFFQFYLNRDGFDVADATSGSEFEDIGGEYPISSGLAEVVLPADRIYFYASDILSPNIMAGEETPLMSLRLERGTLSTGSLVYLDAFDVYLHDGNDDPVDASSVIDGVRIETETGDIPVTLDYQGTGVRIILDTQLGVGSGESFEFDLLVTLANEPAVKSLWASIHSPEDVTCTDEASGDPVTVDPVPGMSFPFNTGIAALLGNNVEDSFSNYPNPFVASREKTRITFYMPGDGTASLKIYTVLGKLVTVLADDEYRTGGLHQDVWWDGTNGRGQRVLNGVYYLVLRINVNGRETMIRRKVALVY